MKKRKFLCSIIVVMLFTMISSQAKEPTKLAAIDIKNLKGETVNTSKFSNDGKPYIVCFWATWCKPCIMEMTTYNESYEEWQKETGLKLYSISIDDSRSSKKVAPFVKGRDWKFEVLLDENSDFRKAMNVLNPPHTFICNSNGEVVWQHTGYAQGDEDILIKEYKKVVDDEKNAKELKK